MVSGRDHEPVTAFFPSIDRNLMLDLGRQLRGAAPQPALAPSPPPAQVQAAGRPPIARVVEAVEQAAQSIAAMTARIDELESHIDDLEAANRHIHDQLDAAGQTIRVTEGRLSAESERASRAEASAAQQAARAADLERDLASARDDLARVTDTIAAALGLPHQRPA